MENLIHELISDRLLELSRYVTLEASSRTILIDRTSMIADGYKAVIHYGDGSGFSIKIRIYKQN